MVKGTANTLALPALSAMRPEARSASPRRRREPLWSRQGETSTDGCRRSTPTSLTSTEKSARRLGQSRVSDVRREARAWSKPRPRRAARRRAAGAALPGRPRRARQPLGSSARRRHALRTRDRRFHRRWRRCRARWPSSARPSKEAAAGHLERHVPSLSARDPLAILFAPTRSGRVASPALRRPAPPRRARRTRCHRRRARARSRGRETRRGSRRGARYCRAAERCARAHGEA